MLSDEERDIDVESDEDGSKSGSTDKRAHHNALERKRRDHIKDSFCKLRDAIPAMQGDKLSRAQILKKASEYILFMRKKNSTHQDVDALKRQNSHLEAQIRALERAKSQGNFASVADILNESGLMDEPPPIPKRPHEEFSAYDAGSGSGSDSSSDSTPHTIAPGQSLLLSAANGSEPGKKRMKVDLRTTAPQESLIKKRSLLE